jgi:hypothetical protein
MPIKKILLLISFVFTCAQAELGLSATLGSISPKHNFSDLHLDFNGNLWYQFDQMVFLGAGSGIQTFGGEQYIPALGSIFMRLPIGGQILPVATGDIGYSFGSESQSLWRAGGGFDIKNGDRSSLLLLGGYQSFAKFGAYVYLRAGLLLEF